MLPQQEADLRFQLRMRYSRHLPLQRQVPRQVPRSLRRWLRLCRQLRLSPVGAAWERTLSRRLEPPRRRMRRL